LVGLFVFFFFFYPFVFSQALDHQRFSQDRRLYRTAGWWQKAHPSNPPSISKFFFFGVPFGRMMTPERALTWGTPWRCELLHELVCPSQGSMTNEISSSESLDYHIIIPAGDGLSISDILQSITNISIFFFYPKRVSIVDSLFRFFFLFRFIQYQHGILHTRTKKIKGEKLKRYCLIFSFVFCLLFLFLGPGGIDQLTSQRVASGRQHQGCIRIYSIPRCYKGGIDPFWRFHM
jgi:hypothetical protein